MHENCRSADSTRYAALKAIQDMKVRLNLRDPFEASSIPSAGSGSHTRPETLVSSYAEAVQSIAKQDDSATNVLEVKGTAPSRSPKDTMHANFVPDLLAASDKTLTSLSENKQRTPSDPFIEPLALCSSSIEANPEFEEQTKSQNHMARPSTARDITPVPRFTNPAKVTKPNDEKRYIASYLNQHQLYMLRQRETRFIRKLEAKSIQELQMLQHKARTCHASNKIKNLIQNAMFEKHMAEMKEWESQLDHSSKDYESKEKTRNEKQNIEELQELQEALHQKFRREFLEATQEASGRSK